MVMTFMLRGAVSVIGAVGTADAIRWPAGSGVARGLGAGGHSPTAIGLRGDQHGMGDAVVHNQKNMRFVLAGGNGDYLKTHANGRYLAGAGDGGVDRHERVLLNLCEAMGIISFQGFGDPGLQGGGKTPIAALKA